MNRSTKLAIIAVALITAVSVWAEQPDGRPVTIDWSHSHLVITNGATLQERIAAGQDPRAVSNWLRRTRMKAASPADAPPRDPRKRSSMQRDWSVSLGAGRVAPGMSPAKYGFFANSTPSCTADYAVYGLDVAGVGGGQANLVGLRNLYSGGSTGNPGTCGQVNISQETRIGTAVTVNTATPHPFTVGMQVSVIGTTDPSANGTYTITSVPSATQFKYSVGGFSGSGSSTVGTASYGAASVAFAYNVTTASGGRVLTSPSISLTGTKIAFVESTSTSSIFHVLTLDPCVTTTSGCTTNGTSATASAAPGSGNSASMVSITYSNSSNTLSSPWVDYTNDVAYVGDNNGRLYRITGVFYGTPTLDTSFGSGGVLVVNGGTKLTGPVLAQGWLFVGDSQGLLWTMQATSPFAILGSVQVGGGQSGANIYGIVDSPVLDASTTGILTAFATSGQSASTGNFTLVQAKLTIATQTFATVTTANLGNGAGSTLINAHAPTFDNNYYNGNITATTGFIYACGMQAASTHPKLYRFGFTAGSPPTMSASANGQLALNNSSVECSPLTEFANPNLTPTDLLFLGDSSGEVQSFNISGAMPGSATATVLESGGTSGIIVDNSQLPNGQGSSIYFTTLTTATGNCGTGNFCAIKLTQSGLF